MIASTLASSSGSSSARPASASASGTSCASSARISSSGSTASTRAPVATSRRVSLPGARGDVRDDAARRQPEPRREPLDRRVRDSPGRARSYSSATDAKRVGDRVQAACNAYDGVTRYASNTESSPRSVFSSERSAFTSPTSAVYQFFAS